MYTITHLEKKACYASELLIITMFILMMSNLIDNNKKNRMIEVLPYLVKGKTSIRVIRVQVFLSGINMQAYSLLAVPKFVFNEFRAENVHLQATWLSDNEKLVYKTKDVCIY